MPGIARGLLAAALLVAAVAKVISLLDSGPPAQDLALLLAYLFGLPRAAILVAAAMVELLVGAALLAPRLAGKAAVVAFCLIGLFTGLVLATGDAYESCGCFGNILKLEWQGHVWLNAACLALAAVSLGAGSPRATRDAMLPSTTSHPG